MNDKETKEFSEEELAKMRNPDFKYDTHFLPSPEDKKNDKKENK